MIFFRRRKAIKLFRKIERYLYSDDSFLDNDCERPSEKRAAQREAYEALTEVSILCLGGKAWRKITLEVDDND
ncbi:MAG: hypothetical protein LIP15_04095 [Clostridium sp.]|nr:hypothetical protein [Clostridium sp.]